MHKCSITKGWVLLLFISLLLFTDQVTKLLVVRFQASLDNTQVFGDFLTISIVRNCDGFLGVAQKLTEVEKQILLQWGVGFLLVTCFVWLWRHKKEKPELVFPLSLVLGGGLSNVIDRLYLNGCVLDFLQIGIGSLQSGIFNLADFFIICGSFHLGATLCNRIPDS